MQTKTYQPKTGAILGVLAFAALFLGFGVFIFVRGFEIADKNTPAALFVLVSLIFFAFGFYFVDEGFGAWMAVDIDNDGITTRGLFGKKSALWRDIVYAEILGTSDENFVLKDRQNVRLELDTSAMIDGNILKAEITTRIEPVLENVMQLWSEQGVTLRPRSPFQLPGSISILIFAALCVMGAWGSANIQRTSPSDAAASIAGTVFGCLGTLLFGWLFLYMSTTRLRLTTDGIRLHNLVSNKKISFSDIAAVSTREANTENVSMRVITVRDHGGKKIMLTSAAYPNSALLVNIIQQAVGEKVLDEGARDIKRQAASETRTQTKFLTWAGPLYIGIFLAPGLMMINQGQSRVAFFKRISAQGTSVSGTVTGREQRGSKSTEYVVYYTFMAADSSGNKRPIKGASPVSYENWLNAYPGLSVSAVYVRSDPELCHLSVSIADRLGEGRRTEGVVYLAIGLVGVALYANALYRSRLKAAGKWSDPKAPTETLHHAAPERYALQRHLRRIGIARILGTYIMGWGGGVFIGLCVISLAASSFVPVLDDAMSSHNTPMWFRILIMTPALVALAGMLIVAPLGEWFAFVRTKAIETSIADPELSPLLALALRRSMTNDKSLSGATSLRLLNALTIVLASDAEAARLLTPPQRGFLYGLLTKWSNRDDRQAYCLAVIHAISTWKDAAQEANLRTLSKTCNQQSVRDAALACLAGL
jgi:hypothetical protein